MTYLTSAIFFDANSFSFKKVPLFPPTFLPVGLGSGASAQLQQLPALVPGGCHGGHGCHRGSMAGSCQLPSGYAAAGTAGLDTGAGSF